jgi:hypothetical protein
VLLVNLVQVDPVVKMEEMEKRGKMVRTEIQVKMAQLEGMAFQGNMALLVEMVMMVRLDEMDTMGTRATMVKVATVVLQDVMAMMLLMVALVLLVRMVRMVTKGLQVKMATQDSQANLVTTVFQAKMATQVLMVVMGTTDVMELGVPPARMEKEAMTVPQVLQELLVKMVIVARRARRVNVATQVRMAKTGLMRKASPMAMVVAMVVAMVPF